MGTNILWVLCWKTLPFKKCSVTMFYEQGKQHPTGTILLLFSLHAMSSVQQTACLVKEHINMELAKCLMAINSCSTN